jgi:hypothetical protein
MKNQLSHRHAWISVAGVATIALLFTSFAVAARTSLDVSGTWSGSFQSDHPNMTPFTITVVITPDANGHLVGKSNLESQCVRGIKLQVTTNGSNVVLAGSDDEGDSLTFRGTLDQTGTLMNMRYIANGSASGRCETDQGSGTMGKR